MENLKIQFFEDSSRKAKLKNINRTVEEIMSKRNDLLFERRNKYNLKLKLILNLHHLFLFNNDI